MAYSLADQLKLEHEQLRAGVERYARIQKTYADRGNGSETSYAKRLMPKLVDKLTKRINIEVTAKGAGRRKKFLVHLGQVEASTSAYLALKTVFDALTRHETARKVALAIGRKIEDEVRFEQFRIEHREYWDSIMADFKHKNTTDYRHKHRVLVHSAQQKGLEWDDWGAEARIALGASLLEFIRSETNLIELERTKKNGKHQVYIIPTKEALVWIKEHMEEAEMLDPELGPTIIPPRDWNGTDLYSGGFYSPEIISRTPRIKLHGKRHRKAIEGHDYSVSATALNLYQRTPWVINQRILGVLKDVYKRNLGIGLPATEPYELPVSPVPRELSKEDMTDEQAAAFLLWKREAAIVYTKERERAAKCMQLSRVLRMAERYSKYDELYFVWQQDSRGRAYAASPGLNPQGCDYVKALLRFKKLKPIGANGGKWLAVQGANSYGVDKASFDERLAWVNDNSDAIIRAADDPIGEHAFWSQADNPYMFLDFCFEWKGFKTFGKDFYTSLPIGMDGSCNGLQNLSAMLLDEVGGRATNLLPTTQPNDIYQQVADVALGKLRDSSKLLAKQWLAFGIDRKCTKRPVMTLPYGATRTSCQEYIYEYMYDKAEKQGWGQWTTSKEKFEACRFMSDIVWASIGEVVVAAREAMDWLQNASRVTSRKNLPVSWKTPTNFLVWQGTLKDEDNLVNTILSGRMRLTVYSPTNQIDSRRQASGVAPNFVHSMDSSHMMMTTILMRREGITDFHMIHDDFGCHAGDVDVMNRCIRKAFVHMYSKHDVLTKFKEHVETTYNCELPDLPEKGTLELDLVNQSEYFFC